jgi:TetR/AcrR family transcriptional repressor of nem operon
MAREKEFDPDTALTHAIDLFWRKGYAATSMNDLVEATGVQRYGLYTTFGDKHSLFLRSLAYYVDVMVAALIREMETETASWPAITAFFQNHLEIIRGYYGQYGCFMCNSAIELAAHDSAVSEQMDTYLNRVHRAFANALTNARLNGDLRLTLSPADAATYLSGVAVGLFNLAKTPMSHVDIGTYIDVALSSLRTK